MKQMLENLRDGAQATAVEAKRQAAFQKKIRRELPTAEFELGKYAFQIDYVPQGGERILESLKHLEEKYLKLDENEQLQDGANWKEKAARAAEDAKKLVKKKGIRKQQKELLYELGQAIHKDEKTPEDSTLATMLEKCKAIDSEIESLQAREDQSKSSLVKYLFVGLVFLLGLGVTYGAYRTFSGSGDGNPTTQPLIVDSDNENKSNGNIQKTPEFSGGGGGGFSINPSTTNNSSQNPNSNRLANQVGMPQHSTPGHNLPPKPQPRTASKSSTKSNTNRPVGNASKNNTTRVAKVEIPKEKPLPKYIPPTRVLSVMKAPVVQVPAKARNLPPIVPLPPVPNPSNEQTSQKIFGIYYVYPKFLGVEISWEDQDSIEKAPSAYTNYRNRRAREQDQSLLFEDHSTENRVGIAGTARFYEIRNPEDSRFRGDNDGDLREFGECKIAGWRDPQLQTFSIWVKKWIEADRPYSSRTTISFRGLYSKKDNQYAGWMNSKYFFLATPNEAVKPELIKRASEAMRFRNPERGTSYAKFEPSPEQLEAALKWLDMFKENIPLEKRERLQMGVHLKIAMTMYLSDEFEKAFGKSVDNLSFNERLKYSFMFEKARQGKYGNDAEKRARYNTAIVRLQTGDTGWAITVAAVWVHRVFRKWAAEQLEKYRNETPHKASFDSMVSFNKIAVPLRTSYFEYEQEAFKKEFATVTQKVADATLLSINYSDDTPRERLSLLYKFASSDVSRKQQDRYRKIFLQRMTAKINQRLKELEAIPDNINAFGPTMTWQSKFEVGFYTIQDEAPYKTAIDYVVKRRNRLASEFQDDVIAKMAASTSSLQVQVTRSEAMPFRSNDFTEAHKKIDAAANIHLERTRLSAQMERAKQQRDRVLALHSKQEREMMKDGYTRISIPEKVPAPTDESIKLAYCREMSYLPGFTRAGPTTLKFAPPFLGKFITYVMEIKNVDVEKVQRVAVNGDPNNFMVNYYVQISFNRKGSINQLGPGSPQEKMLDFLQKAGEEESKYTRKTDVFYLSRDGYRSETIRKAAMKKWR